MLTDAFRQLRRVVQRIQVFECELGDVIAVGGDAVQVTFVLEKLAELLKQLERHAFPPGEATPRSTYKETSVAPTLRG